MFNESLTYNRLENNWVKSGNFVVSLAINSVNIVCVASDKVAITQAECAASSSIQSIRNRASLQLILLKRRLELCFESLQVLWSQVAINVVKEHLRPITG